jgi:DNA polymerase IV (DinB-like DNA polymerase)
MHVDFDYFFAQVEERENPAIKDQPVVVCVYSGRTPDSGAVSTANYIARTYGVKSGMPIAVAKKKLKTEAVFLPVNHPLYDAVSDDIMTILQRYADAFEQAGVDEAFLDVTRRSAGNFDQAEALAHAIQQAVIARTRISSSIGIGPNKLVAKIASGKQKPAGLTVVRPEVVQQFLAPLPVRELPGVGKKTERTLNDLGIRTIGELAAANTQELTRVYGKTFARYLHNAAFGVDESPVEQRGRAESVSRIATLKDNMRDLPVIMEKVTELAQDVYATAADRGVSFKTVTIQAVMNDLTSFTRSRTAKTPTRSLEVIITVAKDLLEQLLTEETDRSIRRVGVKISNFAAERGQKRLTEYRKPPE